MNIFDELESLYNEIDQNYSSVEFEARAKGWHVKEAKYTRKRSLNDQAYFLFMFSRLEDHIRTESANLICRKKLNNHRLKAGGLMPRTESPDTRLSGLGTQKNYQNNPKTNTFPLLTIL